MRLKKTFLKFIVSKLTKLVIHLHVAKDNVQSSSCLKHPLVQFITDRNVVKRLPAAFLYRTLVQQISAWTTIDLFVDVIFMLVPFRLPYYVASCASHKSLSDSAFLVLECLWAVFQ